MSNNDVISQLKSLLDDAQCRADADPNERMWQDDIAALTAAISAVKFKSHFTKNNQSIELTEINFDLEVHQHDR
jgi:hypothetical protein